jgi:hypothetical protein
VVGTGDAPRTADNQSVSSIKVGHAALSSDIVLIVVNVLNGHVLPKSGDIWMQFWEFGFSLNESYVSLLSFNGWYDAGRASHDGPFFIDVYETAQGRRLALIRGSWCDFTPDGVLTNLRWISGRDLVFPYGWEKREMIVCLFE